MMYALPGFMPEGKPKEDAIIVSAMAQGLDLVFFEEDNTAGRRGVVWSVLIQGLGRVVLMAKKDAYIEVDEDSDTRTYRLVIPPMSLPAGTHMFELVLDGAPFVPFIRKFITVPAQLPNVENIKVFRKSYPLPTEGFQASTLRLYDSVSKRWFTLGVVKDGDYAQPTLTEE